MDANGVNMVAVGLEQLGAEEFIEGKFFEGGVSDQYAFSASTSMEACTANHLWHQCGGSTHLLMLG